MLAYVTQRYPFATDVATDGPPEAMVRRQLMPALAALGLIVAGGVVPVALVA
jgi:YidC/Oxa1 family membrane protein insertase